MTNAPAPGAAVCTYLREFSDSIALLSGARLFDFGHLRAVFTGRAMFNRFYDAACPSLVTGADVSTVVGAAVQQNVRPVWLLDADRIDAPLTDALEANGFAPKATWTGMWRSADDVPRVDAPEGITVSEIEDTSGLRAWSRICAEVEGFSTAQEETFAELFETLQHQRVAWRHLIAQSEDRIVATGSLFLTRRIAAIDWVNTVADARHRGIASHLVARLLNDAAGSWDVAVLTSTEAGERLYRRLGFRDCSRIAAYRLSVAP